MKRLPFLISIPHGGEDVPVELNSKSWLKKKDILMDGDAFTRKIYDVHPHCFIVKTSIARAFIDLNRNPGAVPPDFPDGVVKEQTCYLKPIYKPGFSLDEGFISELLEKYYNPYFAQIFKILGNETVILGLDCHSMAANAPPISGHCGQKRPLVNLGNVNGSSCDTSIVNMLALCFQKHYALKEKDISINTPFQGGYITRVFGHNPIPWIQIELSRELYLSEPWFDSETWQIDPQRLSELKYQFLNVLREFYCLIKNERKK